MSGNRHLVEGMYDAWERGDLEAFMDALADDIEWRFADNFIYGEVNPLIGKQALREGSLKNLRTEWENFKSPVDEILDAGDNIIGLGHYTGVHRATGRNLRAQFCHIFTVQAGKVVRWRQYVDTKQFAEIAGGG